MTMKRYTISQLACAARVPISTLRYYERVGLVCPTERAENNYRVYSEGALQTIIVYPCGTIGRFYP